MTHKNLILGAESPGLNPGPVYSVFLVHFMICFVDNFSLFLFLLLGFFCRLMECPSQLQMSICCLASDLLAHFAI